MKKAAKILAFVLIPLLCGCDAIAEPSDLAYVVAIGIDTSETSGCYEFTLQITNPIAISGGSKEEGGEGGEKTISELTVEAPSVFSAVNVANHLYSKRITLAHTALIAFGENIAKAGIYDFAEAVGRSEELRPGTHVTVVRGEAKKYLGEIKPTNEVNPVQYYKMIYGAGYTGFIPKTTARELYIACVGSDGGVALPLSAVKDEDEKNVYQIKDGFEYLTEDYIAGDIKAEGENKTQSYGMAILSQGKMIATAGAVDTEIYNMLTGKYTMSDVVYKDFHMPDNPVTVIQSQKRKPKIKVNIRDTKPTISIELFFEADFRTVSGEYLIEEDTGGFNEQAEKAMEEAVSRFLYKTAREYKSDIVMFSDYAKRCFKSRSEFEDYDWVGKYPLAEFEVKVNFDVRRSGLIDRTTG